MTINIVFSRTNVYLWQRLQWHASPQHIIGSGGSTEHGISIIIELEISYIDESSGKWYLSLGLLLTVAVF